MAVFAYKGRNARGDLVRGTLDGSDSGAVADQLFNIGITPTEIKSSGSVRAVAVKGTRLARFLGEKKVEPLELMLFSRQMYTLLKAGVPIMRALAGLQESSHNPAFVAMLQDLRTSLDSGRELSIAMRRHPKIFSSNENQATVGRYRRIAGIHGLVSRAQPACGGKSLAARSGCASLDCSVSMRGITDRTKGAAIRSFWFSVRYNLLGVGG